MLCKWQEIIDRNNIDNTEVSRYISKIVDIIKNTQLFYSDQIGYDKKKGKHSGFIQYFFDRLNNEPTHSATVVMGDVGIGKSSFIRWWREEFDQNDYSTVININRDDYQNDNPKSVYIQRKSSSDFIWTIDNDPVLKQNFRKKVENLIKDDKNVDLDTFYSGFVHQSETFIKQFSSYNYLYLLTLIICSISEVKNVPTWIFIDNVDLETKEVQESFIEGTYTTYNGIVELATERLKYKCLVHFILMIRPETKLRWRGSLHGYFEKEYEIPDVLAITKRKIISAMQKVPPLKPPLDYKGLFTRVKIKKCIGLADWSLSISSKKWHIDLVHRNVRRFVNAWCGMMTSKNFIMYLRNSNMETYMKLLGKGKFNFFPGNALIDGIGESWDSPLFFNIFGLKYVHGTMYDIYIQNYLIYLRIIQYLKFNQGRTSYSNLHKDITRFFNKNYIEDAVKLLLWVRLIDEVSKGIRNVFKGNSYTDITLTNDSILVFSNTSSLYLDYILRDYWYLSEMSLISYQVKNDYNSEIDTRNQGLLLSSKAVLAFLTSWKDILIQNLAFYKRQGYLQHFKQLFISPNMGKIEWKNIVTTTIDVLNNLNKLNKTIQYREYNPAVEKVINLLRKVLEQGNEELKKFGI